MAEKDLKNTIKIDGEEYDINAVYSNEAGKVTTPLIINESLITGESKGSFNGDAADSTKKEINYVPSTGGKFTGPVHIVASDPPENASIINYGQIETLVNLLTGSSAFAWTPNSKAIPQLDTIKNDAGQIEDLRVVMGTTDHFATFKKLLGTGSSELTIDGNGTVTGVSEIKQTVVIPCKYNNKPVTSIGSRAFYDKKFGGTSIRFSSNITNIASDAFGPAPNTTGPNIKYIIYDGTKDEWDSLMSKLASAGGSTYEIFDFIVDVGNVIITSNIKDYIDGPFIYICNDSEGYDYTDSDPRIRQMYLKLPNNPDFIEISTNAIRLTSWDKTAENKWYYTYETLAAIIAGINSRLAALGSKELELPSVLTDTGDVLIPDTLISDKILVEEAVVPNVKELQEQINDIKGGSGDSLANIRADLNDLAREVDIELNREDNNINVVPRLAAAENNITKLISGDTPAGKVKNSLTITLNDGSTEGTDKFTFDGSAAKSFNIGTLDSTVKLSETIWTDKTIGYINGTAMAPKIVANEGDTLKTMFTNIFGTVTDDSSNLVTNPSISSVSIGNSSYEYGTKLSSVSVTITPVAGSYKYGPDVEGAGWNSNYTLSGSGFTAKSDSTANTQTVTLSSQFTVGESSALTLNVSRAYNAATNTAETKMGNATSQKIAAGTATGSGTFNPSAVKYVYWAKSTSTTTPTSWTMYDTGTTSVTDLQLSCAAGEYIWVATTSNKTTFYAWNDASGKYNTDALPTTKTGATSITNSQGASAGGYYIYRTTNKMLQAVDTKFKLA
jgi:hypothetical protein